MKNSGIILAGGQSSRMKTNKALIKLNKKQMIEYIMVTLKSVVDEIIIVTNDPADYLDFNAVLVTDLIPKRGPLSGIHAGLKASSSQYSFVVACDMPFLSQALIGFMLAQSTGYDAVVPKIEGYYQPLHAVYSKFCVPHIEKTLLEGNFKVTAFYEHINIKYISEEDITPLADINKVFFNINDRDDLIKAEEMVGE